MMDTKQKDYLCHYCGRLYFSQKSLARHLKLSHSEQNIREYLCPVCGHVFMYQRNLQDHMETHNEKKYNCTRCFARFPTRHKLTIHMQTMHGNLNKILKKVKSKSGLKDAVVQYYIKAKGLEKDSLQVCQSGQFNKILKLLRYQVTKHKSSRFYLSTKAAFSKLSDANTVDYQESAFNSSSIHINSSITDKELREVLEKACVQQADVYESYQELSSSYSLYAIGGTYLHVLKTATYKGSSKCMDMPDKIRKSKSVISFKGDDSGKCFLYSLYCLLSPRRNHNKCRINQYRKMSGIVIPKETSFPCGPEDCRRFEKSNSQLAISSYYFNNDDQLVQPLHISKHRKTRPYDLHVLLLFNESTTEYHWCPILSINSFLNYHMGTKHKYYCTFCFSSFFKRDSLARHEKVCSTPQRVDMPNEQEKILRFDNPALTYLHPCYLVSDLECKLVSLPAVGQEKPEQVHELLSFAIYPVVTERYKHIFPDMLPYFYKATTDDENMGAALCSTLNKMADEILKRVKSYNPMSHVTQEEIDRCMKENVCLGCNRPLTEQPPFNSKQFSYHRHHDHLLPADGETSNFVSVTHSICNTLIRVQNRVICYYHNLKSYDGHYIIQAYCAQGEVPSVLMKSSEQVTQITTRKIVFKDSLALFNASLAKIASSMPSDHFICTKKVFKDNYKLFLEKLPFPYKLVTSVKSYDIKISEIKQSDFDSDLLTGVKCSDEEYRQFKHFTEVMKVKNLGETLRLYNLSDTCILADALEHIRTQLYEIFQIDVLNTLTTPHYSFLAFLRSTGVEIERVTDATMYKEIDNNLVGGFSGSFTRHCVANTVLASTYDARKPASFIASLDITNLYGKMMCDFLPLRGFEAITDPSVLNEKFTHAYICNYVSGEYIKGYYLTVDIFFDDPSFQDNACHIILPPGISKLKILPHMYSKEALLGFLNSRRDLPKVQEKLCASFAPLIGKMWDIRYVSFLLNRGARLGKVHSAISYDQSQYIKPYILKCSEMRTKSVTALHSSYWKLMANAIYGKSTQQEKHYACTYKLITSVEQLDRRTRMTPSILDWTIYNPSLVGIKVAKTRLCLKSPRQIGKTVLDLSKVWTLQRIYMQIEWCIANNFSSPTLLKMDTDGWEFCFHGMDIDEVNKMRYDLREVFDNSSFDKDHWCHSMQNYKKLGSVKEENSAKGCVAIQLTSLKPKLWSCLSEPLSKSGDRSEQSKMQFQEHRKKSIPKGISVKNSLYKQCLFERKPYYIKFRSIVSKKMKNMTVNVNKRCLDCINDKMFSISQTCSLPYFTYWLKPNPDVLKKFLKLRKKQKANDLKRMKEKIKRKKNRRKDSDTLS